MYKSLNWNNRYSTVSSNHFPSYPNSNRPRENKSNHSICCPCKLKLSLDFSLVLPWPSFRTSRILLESVCYPWVTWKFISQPLKIVKLILSSWWSRWCNFKNVISFSYGLMFNLFFNRIKGWLWIDPIISIVPLRRHFFIIYYFSFMLS